jgi:hypothetical protein
MNILKTITAPRNTDTILSELRGSIQQLRERENWLDKEWEIQDSIIINAQKQQMSINYEKSHANRVADNLEKLIA